MVENSARQGSAPGQGAQMAPEWRVGTYEWWPADDRLDWSPELARLYGVSELPDSETGFIRLVHPDDRVRVEGETSSFLGSEAEGYSHSFRIIRPDGTVRVILDRGAIERDAAGNVRKVHGINIDITDETPPAGRDASVGAGRRRETQLQLAMQAALAVAFEWDIPSNRVWRILSDVPALPRTGSHPDTFENVAAAVHPDDRAAFRASVETALSSREGHYHSEHRILSPDGSVRWLAESGRLEFDEAGTPLRLVGISHDITRRKRAEEEIIEAKALLEAFFENAPVGLGVWDRDFRFLRINRELAAINGLPREAHIGCRPDEILPELGGLDEVYRRWQGILETGEPWRGVEITGETPARPGHLRRWQEDFFPVRVQGRNIGIAAVVQETTRSIAAEERLKASEIRYRALFEAIDSGFCVLEVNLEADDGRIDYRVLEANPAFYKNTGFPKEILGRWLREAAPDLEEHWYERYGEVARTGEPSRFELGSDLLGRCFEVYAFRFDAPRGARVAVLFDDISERKRHEDHTQLLLREVNHRSKNMLSLVQAIARQTASSGAADFVDRFSQRVMALAAAQDLLVRNSWKTVPMEDLVRAQLAHFSDLVDERITLAGPDLSLMPDATQALGMAMHELATNAAKYGALSNRSGRIRIGWSVGDDDRLEVSWRESGGPAVSSPQKRGFGSRVTTYMVEASTGGSVRVFYAPSGLEWRLSCPAENALAGGPAQRRGAETAPSGQAARSEGGHRVLVVEDEAIIAADMVNMLDDAGFRVLGPASNVAQAMALFESQGCDAAVLDMNLGRETSEAVARRLTGDGIPFIVVSGYSRDQLPEAFRAAPLVGKPFGPGIVESLLRRVLRTGDRPV